MVYFIINKNANYVLPLGFELGIALSPLFSITICATDLIDVWYVYSHSVHWRTPHFKLLPMSKVEQSLLDLFLQGGIKLNRRIKIKDERLKLTCRSHTFKTVLKVRRGNTLAGIYEMVYPIILPSIRYSFLLY